MSIWHTTFSFASSNEPHKDIEAVLAEYSKEPGSESQLKTLLPQIVSSFGVNRSVSETIEELKRHQTSTDTAGML